MSKFLPAVRGLRVIKFLPYSTHGPVRGEKDDISFDNSFVAYKSKTFWEVLRALTVFQITSIPAMVTYSHSLMLLGRKVLGKTLFEKLMRSSFYGQFVGGANEEEVARVMKRLKESGIDTITLNSVEADISENEAQKIEAKALIGTRTSMPEFQVDPKLLDRRGQVMAARTYFYEGEKHCDRNTADFIDVIEMMARHSTTGITQVKLTALCNPKLLMSISETIMKARQYVSDLLHTNQNAPCIKQCFSTTDMEKCLSQVEDHSRCEQFLRKVTADEEGVIDIFPWSEIIDDFTVKINEIFKVPDPKTGQMMNLVPMLSVDDEAQVQNMLMRLKKIIKAAKDMNVGVMIDAEQSYLQPAISRFAVEFMRKYNRDKVIVYNTYQNYLRNTFDEIVCDMEQARRQNFHFGVKLVRGAYIVQERQRSKDLSYMDPTQDTFEATTENYHKVLDECLQRIVKGQKMVVMVASHNEDTVKFAVRRMQELGLDPSKREVLFGQLYGMCDFITYVLALKGYPIYKSVPCGDVNDVMPYISRRAQENQGIFTHVAKEKKLLREDVWRRLRRAKPNQDAAST